MTTTLPAIGDRLTMRDDEGRWVTLTVEWVEPDAWPFAWAWGHNLAGCLVGVRFVTN